MSEPETPSPTDLDALRERYRAERDRRAQASDRQYRDAGEFAQLIADPNAAAFYERVGATFVRNEPSDAIPGRLLPLYEYDLTRSGSKP